MLGHDTVLWNRNFTDLNPLIVGSEKCEPGHSYGPAIRKYTLIHYVVGGKGKLFKNDEEYPVGTGQAFLILPGETTFYRADDVDPWSYQWVGFDGRLTEPFRKLPAVFPLSGEYTRAMLTASENEETREYEIAAILFRMYAALFAGSTTRNRYVKRVEDSIRALYMQDLRVEQIAAQMNLDRRYLSRLFRQKTGQTVQEYLISVRMEEAQILLEQGYSVSEAAHLSGYEDSCNFSKMFKRRFGVSPAGWKKGKKEKGRVPPSR